MDQPFTIAPIRERSRRYFRQVLILWALAALAIRLSGLSGSNESTTQDIGISLFVGLPTAIVLRIFVGLFRFIGPANWR